MDLVTDCKLKLAEFRVKELKDVLSLLGLAKHGRKKDLVTRIKAVLTSEQVSSTSASTEVVGKEEVAKVIDDVYRKMLGDSAIDGQTSCDVARVTPNKEVTNSIVQKIFCPCGFSFRSGFMVECENPNCRVLQHKACVIIPNSGIRPDPPHFYCEDCRINRADPFWVGTRNLLHPVINGGNSLEYFNTELDIHREDLNLTEREGYEIQAWCILLNDVVQFRMQWPLSGKLKVNGIAVKTVNRLDNQMLGLNGRDDGAPISMYLEQGLNKISLSACDYRSFVLGVRLVKPRTIQEVFSLIPKEHEGEPLTNATARVIRCVSSGTASTHEDAESDLEVLADSVMVDLRCPISGARMKTASRFKSCVHMGCFDLESFLRVSQTTRKWQCPLCLKNYSWEDIIIDPYFNQVIRTIEQSGSETTKITIKPDGVWSANNGPAPDCSICDTETEPTSNMDPKLKNKIVELKVLDECQTLGSGGSSSRLKAMSDCDSSRATNIISGASLVDPEVIVLSDSEDESICTRFVRQKKQ